MAEAAMVLGVSERQSFRLKARIRKEGVRGVVHGNRGRSSPRKLPVKTRHRIVELARTTYRGFNDHHLTEKLADAEGIPVSRETVRRILRAEGLASPRKRRPPRHRGRRARRPAEGMLLQVDGSPHDWLEGRGPALTLVGAIDDARARSPVPSLKTTRRPGPTCICSGTSFGEKASPRPSTRIGTRSSGRHGSRHLRSSSRDGGPGRRWTGRWTSSASR